MKTLLPKHKLWIERGMLLGNWLKNLFGAISQLRRRRVRQPLHDRDHGRSHWQAPGH